MQEKFLYLINVLTNYAYRVFKGNPSNVNPAEVNKIVCVKLDEIGDMVTALHVFQLLKLRFPNAEITVVCKPFVGSLLSNNPNIDLITSEVQIGLKADVWVELRGTWLSWWRSLMSGCRYRVDRGIIRFKQRGNQPHETITNFRIIEPLLGGNLTMESSNNQLFLNESEMVEVDGIIQKLGMNDHQNVCFIHPGGRSILRRWPAERFNQIIQYLNNQGFLCVVFGSSEERDLLSEFKSNNDLMVIWETAESLKVFYGVLKNAQLFIGNESGPLQLADLAGVPSVGLFGPGVKNVFYPKGKKSKVIHKILDCNPCDQKNCIHFEKRCMLEIDIEEVIEAVKELAN